MLAIGLSQKGAGGFDGMLEGWKLLRSAITESPRRYFIDHVHLAKQVGGNLY